MVSTKDLDGKTSHYYRREGVVIPDTWKKLPVKSWPKRVMLAMGICWREKLWLYVVSPGTKVEAPSFVDLILKPMIQKDIKRMYGKEWKKVNFHMDSAPSHTADFTTKWLKKRKMKWIPKEHWLSNSPDLAPMDFAVNGILRRILKRRQAYSLDELVRVAKSEWRKFPIPKIRCALLSWRKRVELMEKKCGFQFEQDL